LQAFALGEGAPPVLLVGAKLPAAVVRNLMRLERSDVLEAPFKADQFVAAVNTLLAGPRSTSAHAVPAGGSHCWAITSAVGGAGARTLAVEVASALAARAQTDKSVCLIDLNLADGAAAAYLGVQPAMRLAEFNGRSERIDSDVLQALTTSVSKQLDLLAAPRD